MNSKNKGVKTVSIKGMHCKSCELLIEDNLLKVNGVSRVKVDHRKGLATISHQGNLSNEAVAQAVEKAGYEIGTENLALVSSDFQDYIDLGWAFFIVFSLYIVASSLGLFSLTDVLNGSYSNLGLVFLVGITAGFSTCMAMVGGLVLGMSSRFSEIHPNASGIDKFKPHLVFNSARVVSYTVLGGAIGLLGSAIQLSPWIIGILTLAVAILMLVLGTQLIDIFPFMKKISLTLPKEISRKLGIGNHSDSKYTHRSAAILGALTFFLPCGFTQAMQLFAMSTGSLVAGALTMGVFALGTTPGLLGIGGLTSFIKGAWSKFFFKSAGIVVIYLSLMNFSGGLTLLGINVNLGSLIGSIDTQKPGKVSPGVTNLGDVQEVRMTQNNTGYVPNNFIIQKGIPVRWIINSTSAFSCASSLISPQLGIRTNLNLGENIIEFTPQQTGTITFSCSMGMYSGFFKVVNNI